MNCYHFYIYLPGQILAFLLSSKNTYRQRQNHKKYFEKIHNERRNYYEAK
ncbi:hypothetical protein RUMHYD_03690 [Blautia hydrogenotrophica DSM 10507]|uniref:Uncharacterized protein n=1 Tax=Blautia hydrogenotrophica (strain DSM 10507 / JCM 14656 / S5a33) TaxID=476272 RepID=C0CS24_BLAHS|nr:hypothetical protein RUMHYD_03690 [Blautia hydrogenotrophica DSM 10507]